MFFLDADDFLLDENCFDKLIFEMAKEEIDLVRFDYQAVDEKSNTIFINGNIKLRKKILFSVIEYFRLLHSCCNG